MPSMKRVKERRLSTPVRPCHHNQSGSLMDILDCQIRKAFEITYFGSFQSHAYASIVFALHLSIEARAADQLPATGPVRHLSIDGFSATRFGWRKAGKPVGWLGLMVASGAGCCTAWPLDTDKQNKPSRLLRTLGSWGDAGQRRLSDINSSRLHDLIASYTMQHPDWQQSIRQPRRLSWLFPAPAWQIAECPSLHSNRVDSIFRRSEALRVAVGWRCSVMTRDPPSRHLSASPRP